jgi:predicted dehydrogenase
VTVGSSPFCVIGVGSDYPFSEEVSVLDRPVGWGFIGSSGWVSGRFAKAVADAGQTVVGAFGSRPDGSAAFSRVHNCSAFRSLEEMLDDPAVEAVWVASPTVQHVNHALAAHAAGKAVLVEKPLAVDGQSARKLCEAVGTDPDRLIATAFQHRFNPSVLAAKGVLEDGTLGRISSALIHRSVDVPGMPSAWRLDPLQSGGWSVTDIGTHLLDIARLLFGDVEFWASRLSSPGLGLGVDDLSIIVLRSGEASIVVRASSGTTGPASLIEISGSAGWARVDDFWGGAGRLTCSSEESRPISAADPYVHQVVAFSAAVRGAGWSGATLEDGRRVTEIVDEVRAFNLTNSG